MKFPKLFLFLFFFLTTIQVSAQDEDAFILNSSIELRGGEEIHIWLISRYIGYSKDVVIPDSLNMDFGSLFFKAPVREIKTKSFKDKELKTLVIPNTISVIEYEAFYDNNLTSVTIKATTPPRLHVNAFKKNPPFTLKVPQQSLSAYKNHPTWKLLKPRVEPTITFNNQTKEFTNNPITLNATSNSGGKIIYSIVEGGSATASLSGERNEILQVTSFGTVKIRATVLEKGDYVSNSITSTLFITPDIGAEFSKDGFVYKVIKNTIPFEVSIKGYTGAKKAITISETVAYSGIDYTITAIEEKAFWKGDLEEVEILGPITTIGEFAFMYNNLTNINLPQTIQSIGQHALGDNNLSNINIPNSLTVLETAVFSNNKLTEVVIPENITEIKLWAFAGNNEMTTVTLPKSLQKIGNRVFESNLEEVIVHAVTPPTISDPFNNFFRSEDLLVVVPEGRLSAYKNDEEWKKHLLKEKPSINFEDISIPFSETITLNATSNSGGAISYEIVQGGTTTANLSGANNQIVQPTNLGSLHIKAKIAANGDYLAAEKTAVITLTRRNEFIKEGIHYKIVGGYSVSITNYSGTDTELIIPKEVIDLGRLYTITIIEDNAFKNKQITKIRIPKWMNRIEENAFQDTPLNYVILDSDNPPTFTSNTFDSNANFKLQVDPTDINKYKNSPWAVYLPKVLPSISFYKASVNLSENITLKASSNSRGKITYTIVPEGTTAEATLSGENNKVFTPKTMGEVVIKASIDEEGDYLTHEKTAVITIKPSNKFSIDGLQYQINSNTSYTVTIIDYTGENRNINIPESVEYLGNSYSVTVIGASAFINKGITEVHIPNTVKTIEHKAFVNNQLKEVILPNSINQIHKLAFANNQISHIEIPASITDLNAGIFANNELTEVHINGQIESMTSVSFYNNPISKIFLKNLTLPRTDGKPFGDNNNIIIQVPYEQLAQYKSNVNWRDYTYSTMPDLNFYDVTKKFSESIELKASSVSDGEITYTILPGGTATATLSGERNQFLNPTNTGTIKLKASIAAKGSYLATDTTATYTIVNRTEFEKEGIVYAVTTTKETPTVEVIDYTGASKEVSIPSNVNDAGITYTVTSIGTKAFYANGLSSIDLSNSIVKIGPQAFQFNNLTDLILPESLTEIGLAAFNYNSLTTIILPESLKNIKRGSFANNKIKEVTIPASVTYMEELIFINNSLEHVVLNATIPPDTDNGKLFPENLKQLIVPFSSITAYWQTEVWRKYKPQAIPPLALEDFNTTYGTEKNLPISTSFNTNLSYKIIEGGSGKAVISSDNTTFTPIEVGTVLIEATSLESERYLEVKDTITATIVKKPITIEAIASSKVYGDTDAPLPLKIAGEETNTSALNSTFFLNGNDQLSGALTRANGETVGEYAITSTLANPNYDITFTGATFTIQKKEITVTADVVSKQFGNEDPEFTYRVTPSGIDLTSVNGTLTREAGENVGSYEITSLLTSNNFTINYTPAALTITKKPLTVKAIDKEQVYGEESVAFSYEVLPALTENESLDIFMFKGSTSTDPGRYLIHIEGNNSNYAVTWEKGIYTIKKKPLIITANPITQVYDAAEKPLTYSLSENLVGNDVLTGTLAREAGQLPGTYTISSTLSHPNYDITYKEANYVITKKSITLTAHAKTKVYGAQDPALTYSLSDVLIDGVSLQGGLIRESGDAPGTYEIRSNISHPLYDITYIPADFTITKKPLTITADSKIVEYGEEAKPLTYTLSEGLVGTDNLVGQLSRETRETVGIYPITSSLSHPGYNITFVTANYEITKKPITISAEDKAIFYGDTDVPLTYTTEPAIVNGDVFSGELTRAEGKEVGEYLISSTIANSNYDITFESAKYIIADRKITIKAHNTVKLYNDPDPELKYTVVPGLIGNDELTGSITRASGEELGDYQISSTLVNDKYEITFEPGTFSILPQKVFEKDGFIFEIISAISPYTVKLTGVNFNVPDITEITEVTIPNTVENSTITYTVTGIGDNVFLNMTGLVKVNLPNQLAFIGTGAFQNAALNAITFPNTLLEIGNYAFKNNNLEEVVLTDNVRFIGAGAFENNNIATVSLPEQLEIIESEAFAGNKLTEIDLPDALTYIQPACFKNNLLSRVSLPENLFIIGEEAFSGNELTELALPKLLMEVGIKAFAGNKLKHIMVSNQLMMLGMEAFNQPEDKFEYIIVDTPEPPMIEEFVSLNATFGKNPENIKVLVPAAQLAVYEEHLFWNLYQLQAMPEILFQDTVVTFGDTLNLEASIVDVEGDFEFFIENGGTGLASLSGVNNSVLSTNRAGEVLVKVVFTEANGYYQLEKTSTITIAKKDIDIIVNSQSKFFGDEDPALTYLKPKQLRDINLDGGLYRVLGEQVGTYEIKSTLNSLNYNINIEKADFTIKKKSISVAVGEVTKIYGEVDPEITYQLPPTFDWIDLKDIKGNLTREAGEAVGTYKITSSLESENFEIHTVIEDFKILPRPITLTANESSKTYGDEDPVFTYSLSEKLLNEDKLEGSLTRVLGEDVGTYAIESTLQNPNYDIDFVSKNVTITPRKIFVIADNVTKSYGTQDPELSYTLSEPLLNNQVLQGSLSRESGENAGTYTTISNFYNSNYDIDFISSEFIIVPKQISVAVSNTKVYGEPDPEFNYTLSDELIGNDTLTGTITRATGEDAGSYAFISTLENSNYSISLDPSEFIITPKPITVTVPNTKMYGNPDPEFNYTLSDELIGNDTLTGSITRAFGEDVGTYLLISNLENSNYNISLTSSEFTITPKLITATVYPDNKIYGDEEPILNYELSDFPLATDNLTINISRETGEDIGTYTLTSSSNNSNYNIALSSSEFKITPKPITVSLFINTKVYGEADPELTYILSESLIGSDALTGQLSREPGEDVGTYAISSSLENANYTIDFTASTFEITPKPIAINANPITKVYGEADPELTYTLSESLIGSDALTGQLSREPGEDVGTYAISSSLENANYTIDFTASTFEITPKPIAINANPITKVYGEADPELTYTLSESLIGSDALTGQLSREPGEDVGTYAISSSLENANYTIDFTASTFEITPKPIVINANPITKVYGEADPELTYTLSESLIGSDALTGQLSREPGEDVGTYAISSSLENANYTIDFTASTFEITPKPIAINANPITKVYGEADPELTYILSESLIGSDALTGQLSREPGEDVGTYAISSSLENTNYTIDFTASTFEITKASQIITFDSLAEENINSKTIVLTAEATSGLSISYTSSNESIATILGNELTVIATGTVIITASQEGNANYKAADPVSQELRIVTLSVLEEEFKSRDVMIYPNPSNSFIQIKGIKDQGYTVSIFNIEGKLIKKVFNYLTKNKIEISNLKNGTYILKITKDKKLVTKKFLKI
ncbi:MBG domain-containing protein [uncultured Polaribacter sp.]|uniref:MBG domain-containing protein n=1 Tax=uncultured Polaribacter sp. TaxID=174711 RepID=UPI00263A381F|nr:MBG domain-containing protein [uncultured Polaribacter sp.]